MEHKIVEVKNLSHRYTVNWAIKDINFEIEKNGVSGSWARMEQVSPRR